MHLATACSPDRGGDLVGFGILQQIPGCTCLEGAMDQVGLGEAGHRHHFHLGMALGDGRGGR
jgi:hypothetical protein